MDVTWVGHATVRRLYLTGVDETLAELLHRVRKLDLKETVQIVPAEDVIGKSTQTAVKEAQRWLAGGRKDQPEA